MDIIQVEGYQITKLQSVAEGFCKALYVTYNSAFAHDGCEPWMHSGDEMAVMATNGCLSIELYLKFLTVLATYQDSTNQGEHLKTHDLIILYNDLNQKGPTYISDIEKEYQSIQHKGTTGTFKDFCDSVKEYFIEWRYAHTASTLSLNLNTLSDVLNILDRYSENAFRSVSAKITKHPANWGTESMSIDLTDEIKKWNSIF